MNTENINTIVNAIKKLQHDGINVSDNLNTEKILCDFDSLQQLKNQNRFTLSADYRFMKVILQGMLKSLATVTDDQVKLFVPLSNAIDKIKLELSNEYEQKKIMNLRIRQLREHCENTSDSDNEEGGPLTVLIAKQNPWETNIYSA